MLHLAEDGIRHLYPTGKQTVAARWDPDLDPHEAIVDTVAELGLKPFMVHSTSWRVERKLIVLTFLVAVERPERIPNAFEVELVARTELARGYATGPPCTSISLRSSSMGSGTSPGWSARTVRSTMRSRIGRAR